ncbi:hypothetical protein Q5P01_001353 [Channa striata]|uniref:Apolipoprotein M n=1 Tax=Channa striata TaxID=64152 RepID=A0AA88NM67_CHASR|nr:hypothetical protein Q5P01_001353 [Channa striata]
MRTCVAVVVLSLISACQPAPACDRLLKPLDKSPDLSGSWFVIAMSSDVCLIPALFNSLFWPSIAVDVTPQATPKIYEAKFKFKINRCCAKDPQPFFFENNTMFDVDSNKAPTGDPDVLLQSGCPDCLVVKMDDSHNLFLLLSKRQNVTAAELAEFESQADCLGWFKPHVLNTDHDYENCNRTDDAALNDMIHQRLKHAFAAPVNCMVEKFLYYPNVAYTWAQQKWNTFW